MLTNKLNLPEPILRAAERELYSNGEGVRYSVTELLKPPRMAALQRLYADAIVEDVADNIWSILGRIGHGILEASGAPITGAILEERLYADVLGVRISGAMDHTVLLPTGCLDDYKFTNVYAVSHGLKREWEQQLNIYAWLRGLHGQTVERLRVVAILRDWLISRARAAALSGASYPQLQVVTLDVPLWPFEETQAFVEERVREHLAADAWAADAYSNPSAALVEPLCTDEDRWTRPTRYALMKKGRKTAVKLYDTNEEAQMVANAAPGQYVELRGGEPVRCIDYCTVGRAGLCSQWNLDRERFSAPRGEIDTSAFD